MSYLIPGDRVTVTSPTVAHRDLYGMRGTVASVYPSLLVNLDEGDEEPFAQSELTVGTTVDEAMSAAADRILQRLA